MHHVEVPGGAAVPERMWERIIKELLESGATSIRTSVLWSAGNEVASGATLPAYVTTTMGQLVPYINQFDKTRPVIHASVIQDPAGMVSLAKIQNGVVGMNYGGWASGCWALSCCGRDRGPAQDVLQQVEGY